MFLPHQRRVKVYIPTPPRATRFLIPRHRTAQRTASEAHGKRRRRRRKRKGSIPHLPLRVVGHRWWCHTSTAIRTPILILRRRWRLTRETLPESIPGHWGRTSCPVSRGPRPQTRRRVRPNPIDIPLSKHHPVCPRRPIRRDPRISVRPQCSRPPHTPSPPPLHFPLPFPFLVVVYVE